jgi:hypothetical protein
MPRSHVQRELQEQLGVLISISHLNAVRALHGWRNVATQAEKHQRSVEMSVQDGAGGLLLLAAAHETGLLSQFEAAIASCTPSTPRSLLSSSLSERTEQQSWQSRGQHVCRSEHWQERQNGPRLPTEESQRWCSNDLERCPVPHYAQDKVWNRLRLKAKQTKHHSPAAAVPRKENWRKPRTSLMIPITGSTVHLRAP